MRLGLVGHSYREKLQAASEPAEAGLHLAKEKGVQVYGGPLGDWQDPAHLEKLVALRGELDIELEGGWGYDFVLADHDVAEHALAGLSDYLEHCCKPLGIRTIGTCAHTDRWMKEIPLQEALERLVRALEPAAHLCERAGARLALENHADYRGHEIAWVIEQVNRPGLGARLDTGNAFWTFEDPWDAAVALAPHTITTHIKDIRVIKHSRNEGAVLGQGHVPFEKIIPLLAEKAPDPASLPLMAEIEALPEGTNQTAATDASLEYLRTTFAEHLEN